MSQLRLLLYVADMGYIWLVSNVKQQKSSPPVILNRYRWSCMIKRHVVLQQYYQIAKKNFTKSSQNTTIIWYGTTTAAVWFTIQTDSFAKFSNWFISEKGKFNSVSLHKPALTVWWKTVMIFLYICMAFANDSFNIFDSTQSGLNQNLFKYKRYLTAPPFMAIILCQLKINQISESN